MRTHPFVLHYDSLFHLQGLLFGDRRWLETVQTNRGWSAQEIQEALIKEVFEFVGDAPQFDDITLMVIVRGISK